MGHLGHMAHVALTTRGRYLRLAVQEGEHRVAGDATALDLADVYERVELPHGRILLRTRDGRYLARRPDGGLNFGLYPEVTLTSAAVFEEIRWPSGEVSLRSADLTYVGTSDTSPAVTVNRVHPGPCERFSYVPVPDAAVPAQRRPRSGVRHREASRR